MEASRSSELETAFFLPMVDMEWRAMSRVVLIVTASVIVAGLGPRAVYAQETREGATYLLVPGFVYQQATFGDDDPESNARSGLTIGVQIRGPRPRSMAFVFEATGQLHAVENPHFPERFVPFYAQLGAQIGRGVYVRPSGGVAFQSGSVAPVFGAAIGRDQRFGSKYLAGAEFIIRVSGSHGLVGWIAGLQVPIGVRPSSN